MKRLIMLAAAALLCAAPAANAQKVNDAALKSKAAKSDSDIQDAKKAAKGSTWLNRGKAYYDVAAEPTAGLFGGMPSSMIVASIGEPLSKEQVEIQNTPAEKLVYDYVDVYVANSQVFSWEQTKEIIDGAIGISEEAYVKAAEVDPKQAQKAKEGLLQIKDFYLQTANNMTSLGDYVAGADAFKAAYEIGQNKLVNQNDTSYIFNAGYLYALASDFDNAEVCLQKALDNGYYSDGDVYYLLFHCYYRNNEGDMAKSKQMLLDGIAKFPKNENIMESMMAFYSREGSEDDPEEIFAIVKKAISEDPTNPELWAGLGNIYLHTQRWDDAIEAYGKVVELQPDVYINQLRLGYVYCSKADSEQDALLERSFTSYAESEAAQQEVNKIYAMALPSLEKAHELSPKELTPVQMLKEVYFRLRYDSDEMMKKSEEYSTLFKEMEAQGAE